MARSRSIPEETLVNLTNECFVNNKGDPSSLKYRNLSRFAEKCGIHADEHLFRRSDLVKERIQYLKEYAQRSSDREDPAAVCVSIDVDAFIDAAQSSDGLRIRLTQLNEQWGQCSRDLFQARADRRKLEEQNEELRRQSASLAAKVSELEKAGKRLTEQRNELARALRTYVYPEAAKRILSKSVQGLIFSDDCDSQALDELTHGLEPGAGVSSPPKNIDESIDASIDDVISFASGQTEEPTKEQKEEHI